MVELQVLCRGGEQKPFHWQQTHRNKCIIGSASPDMIGKRGEKPFPGGTGLMLRIGRGCLLGSGNTWAEIGYNSCLARVGPLCWHRWRGLEVGVRGTRSPSSLSAMGTKLCARPV
jgi:hypothetical protein